MPGREHISGNAETRSNGRSSSPFSANPPLSFLLLPFSPFFVFFFAALKI